MTIRLSTLCANKLLDGGTTGGLKGQFNGAFVAIYAGSQPSDPDLGSGSATLLGTVTNLDDGVTGIQFDAAVAGVSSKAAAQTWRFHGLTAGTAGWFRIYQAGDTPSGAASTFSRLDGSIGTAGADMNISNTAIVAAAITTVDTFTVTMPRS